MRRAPCSEKDQVKRGTWSPEEDKTLCDYISKYGPENWPTLPNLAGLRRCGKSCRQRWMNYLRPGLKRGPFTAEEVKTVMRLHDMLGNKWSSIAAELPGRTANDVKNLWNSPLKRQVDTSGSKGSETDESINNAKSEQKGLQNQSSGAVVTAPDSRIINKGPSDQFGDEYYNSDSPLNYNFLVDSPGCNDLGFLQDNSDIIDDDAVANR